MEIAHDTHLFHNLRNICQTCHIGAVLMPSNTPRGTSGLFWNLSGIFSILFGPAMHIGIAAPPTIDVSVRTILGRLLSKFPKTCATSAGAHTWLNHCLKINTDGDIHKILAESRVFAALVRAPKKRPAIPAPQSCPAPRATRVACRISAKCGQRQ